MVSEKSLLEVLKSISSNTWAVVAFICLGVSWALVSFLKDEWLKKEFLSIEILYLLYILVVVSGVFVFLAFVNELRKEAKVSEPFRKLLEKHNPSSDQIADLEMFLSENRNIMNEEQLASDQLSAINIIVVAPHPLEITSQKVLDSTSEWLKQHKRDSGAFIEYWSTNRFDNNPPIAPVISKLVAMAGNREILSRIKCVTVPDELLFIDFTVWVYDDENIRAFANDKGEEGKNYRLWELHWQTARNMYEMLQTIKSKGVSSKLVIPCVGGESSLDVERISITHVPHDAIERLRNESEKQEI